MKYEFREDQKYLAQNLQQFYNLFQDNITSVDTPETQVSKHGFLDFYSLDVSVFFRKAYNTHCVVNKCCIILVSLK